MKRMRDGRKGNRLVKNYFKLFRIRFFRKGDPGRKVEMREVGNSGREVGGSS